MSEAGPLLDVGMTEDSALLAASAPPPDLDPGASPTQAQLDAALTAAELEWSAIRADADFSGVMLLIADLPGLMLGQSSGSTISIDRTAAGWGWATMDLRSVLLHELGHALGLTHADDGVMAPMLAPGQIRGPPGRAITIVVEGSELVLVVDGVSSRSALDAASGLTIEGSSGDDAFTILTPLPTGLMLSAGAGRDRLTGPATDLTWSISGAGAGTVAGAAFTGFEDLTGAAGNRDAFVFGPAGALSGTVAGGDGGFDTVEVVTNGGSVEATVTGPQSGTLARSGDVVTYAGMEPTVITGASSVVVTAPAGATTVIADSGTPDDGEFTIDFGGLGEKHVINAGAITNLTLKLVAGFNTVTIDRLDSKFKGSLTIAGGTGTDAGDDWVYFVEKTNAGVYTFNGGDGEDALIGPDLPSTWNITGADAGDLRGELAFTSVENLFGGSDADVFVLQDGGSISVSVDGGEYVTDQGNSLTYSARSTGPVTVDLATSSATDVKEFLGIQFVFGSGGTDTITGRTAGSTFVIDGADSGVIDAGLADEDDPGLRFSRSRT